MWHRRKHAFTVHKKKNQSPRWRMARRVLLAIVIIFLLGGTLYAVWHVTRLPALTISDVTVTGGATVSDEVVQKAVHEALSGTYYRLIPKSFAYMYPKHAITEAIAQLPRIKDVDVKRPNNTTLAVTFSEYEPFALWCNEASSATCLFIDDSGYAFVAAPELQGSAYLRLVMTDQQPSVGTSILAPQQIEDMAAFAKAVEDLLDLHIVAAECDNADVTFLVAGGGELRASFNVPFADTLQNLKTVLDSNEFSHLKPGNFQYIDLRYGNKVFVHEGVSPDGLASTTEETVGE